MIHYNPNKQIEIVLKMKTKNINLFGDGKLARAVKATIVREKHNRILIRYKSYDYDLKKDVIVTRWFKRVRREDGGTYTTITNKDNMWFYKNNESKTFNRECKDWFGEEYYAEYFAKRDGCPEE